MKKLGLLSKLTASIVLVTFTTQIAGLPAGTAFAQVPVENQEQYQTEKETSENVSSSQPEVSEAGTSTDFLREDSALKPLEERVNPSYNPIPVERALDDLRVDYAAAVPLEKHLSKEEWDKLAQHAQEENIEIAVIVVPGQKKARTVLVTIGSTDEIMTSEAGRKFIDTWGRFVSHLHTDKHAKEGPTGPDFGAVPEGQIHYLRTPNQAYAYSNQGVTDTLSFDSFFERYEEAIQKASEEEAVDDSVVTNALNQLIAEQDKLNEHPSERKPWLAGGTVSPDSTLTSTSLTNFSGSPWVLLDPQSSSGTTIIQQSLSQFQMNYDVNTSSSRAFQSFDNPTTAAVESVNLAATAQFIVGVSGPQGSIAFEVEDSLGARSSVTLLSLTSKMQYYKISQSLFTGLDWTKIKRFAYSIDSTLTSTLTGALTLQTKTLLFSTTALTNLPNNPTLSLASGSSAGTVLRQVSNNSFGLDFSLPQSGDNSSAVMKFPSARDLSSLTQFVFSASGPSKSKLKVTITDSSGAASSVLLSLIPSTQYYILPTSVFQVDRTKVQSVTVSIDPTLTSLTSGTFTFGAKTLLYSTALATNLISKPNPVVLEGSSAGTYLTEPSLTQMKLNLDVTKSGSSSGMSFRFDHPATTTVETQDLSQGSLLTFGLQAGSSAITKIRMEVRDNNGGVASKIFSINTGLTYVTVQKASLTGVDWTSLTSIDFIVDRSYVNSSVAYTSYVFINANSFLFTKTVLPTSTLTSANISTLAGGPALFMLPGSSLPTRVSAGTDQFTLNYDLTPAPDSFSGVRLNYDLPSTTAVETVNLSTTSNIVFGVSASSNTVRVTLVDNLGKKSSVFLTGVAALEKYFQLFLSSFTGIDKTKIREIRFEIEPVVARNAPQTGTVTVSIKGPAAPSFAAPVLDPFNSVNETLTQVFSGTKGVGTGIAVNGVNGTMVVPPTDSTTWTVEVALSQEGVNAFDIQETNGAGTLGPVTQVSITRDTLPPTGSVEALQFTDLTVDAVQLKLALNGVDLGTGVDKFSYSIDGGPFSEPETYTSSKTISLLEGAGRRKVAVKFYDKTGKVSEVFTDEVNLEAIRAVAAFDPESATKPIHELVQEGMLQTDERGNLLALYDRDLLVSQTQFSESSFTITAPAHGATLPSLSAEFEIGQGTPALLLETGFMFPLTLPSPQTGSPDLSLGYQKGGEGGVLIRGEPVRGTAQLVIEDGFFKLKVKRPVEEVVDGIPFLIDREEVIISKHTPQTGKRYEIQFDFTVDGLAVYLDEGKRGIVSTPLFVLAGVEAASTPYLTVNTTDVTMKSVVIYGDTKKILLPNEEIHSFSYTKDASGNLTELVDTIGWSRFADPALKDVSYTVTKTFDTNGRLTSVTNRNGETAAFTYDASGRITEERNSATGETWNTSYSQTGAVLTVTETLTSSDGFGNSISRVTKEDFDTANQNRRTRLETPEGKIVDFVTANVTEGGFSYTVTFTPDSRGRLVDSLERSGAREQRTYTLRADGTEEVVIDRSTPDVNKDGVDVTYQTRERIVTNREGRILEREDINGRIARWAYDAEGDLTRFDDGFGRTTTWAYVKNAFGQILRATETLAYTDDFGNAISAVKAREFDLSGNLIAEIDPDGKARVHVYEFYSYNHKPKTRTSYFYKGMTTLDDLRSAHSASPSSVTSKIEWDETGEVTLEKSQNSVETRRAFSRDLKGNVTGESVTTLYTVDGTPVSRTESREFDLHGNVTKETDFLGNETRYAYDSLDQLLSITRHLAQDSTNQFDRITTLSEKRNTAGILLSTEERQNYRDGFGNPIETRLLREYDAFGNITHEAGPAGDAQVTQYEFRLDGRVSARTTYQYHSVASLDDLKAKHTSSPSSLKERIEYGLLSSPGLNLGYGEIKRREGFDEKTLVFITDRDTAGRIKTQELQTTWLTQRDGSVTTKETFEWDADGNLTRRVLVNGDEILHTYGALGARLTSLQRVRFTGLDGVETIYEEKTTFGEVRSASGQLSQATEKVEGVDSFGNIFTNEAVRTFNEFGEETASIDRTGKGRVTEYTRFPWDEIEEVRVYEYEGVDDLTALQDRHNTSPKLVERTKYSPSPSPLPLGERVGVRGEIIETETKDKLVTLFERTRRTNGLTEKETRRLQIPNEPEKVFVDEFDIEGKPAKSTDDQGIVTAYTYALTGELLSQKETGQGEHSIETRHTLLTYANGIPQIVSTTIKGIDRFGRIVDLASAREFSPRGELAYEVTEDDRGKILSYERDSRDRLIKFTTTELEDGRGFAGGGKLTIDLFKSWYAAPPAGFPPRITIQEWDSLGNETLTETPEERQSKLIYANSLGTPAKIEKQIFHPLGDKVPMVRIPIQTETFVSAGSSPRILIRETPVDLSLLTGPGIAAVFWTGEDDTNSLTKVYAAAELGSLVTDLNSRSDGDYVILVTRGDLRTNLNEAFFQAIEAFGSQKVRSLSEGGAFALLGIKGKGPGQAIENWTREDKKIAKAQNFRHTIENYDTHGYLTHYEDGFGSVFDYTRGFDGEALKMVETRDRGAKIITTTYTRTKDALGRVVSTTEHVEEKTLLADGSYETKIYDKGRAFGASEILTSRTDSAGVTTTFNQEGDIVKVNDPANGIVKTYEIEKYATGTLKRKKETIAVTAKNVEGVEVTTTVSTESLYDVDGKLVQFTDTAGGVTDYSYTQAGETKTVNLPNGERIEYSYSSDTSTGNRTTTETHYKGDLKESEVVKIHNKEGDLIFLSEHLTAESIREEITYTNEYWPGAERRLRRREALHRFIDVSTGALVLQYTTFEDRSEDGLILASRDRDGVEKTYQYREKRVWEIRETHAGDVTMHYYLYRTGDSHSTLQHTLPSYSDLDNDEGAEDGADLDFVFQVRDRATSDTADDEIQIVQYSGKTGNERIEKKVLYHLGGATNPNKEFDYVYHFDGSLDQIRDSQWDYPYNPATGQIERGARRPESTTTYKTDSLTGEPRIDKITDAFRVMNHFYTSTGRLERVEETNGAFPNRVTTSYYNAVGDIVRVKDFYDRQTFFEYVKNSAGRNIALFETNDQHAEERIFRMLNNEGETTVEIDRNGRVALSDPKPHPTRLGKTITETTYFLEDSSLWLTPWFTSAPSTYQEILTAFDKDGNGKIEDGDLQAVFDSSGFPAGTGLHRDKTHKVLNREGDIVLSLKPEGELAIDDYAKDIFEAKTQTQWNFYLPAGRQASADPVSGYVRIDLDNFDAVSSSAWTTLGGKLLKAGARDYEELTATERAQADQARQDAVVEFLVSLGKIGQASDLLVSKTIRRHNSNGELTEETEPTGLKRQTVYGRDSFGVPVSSVIASEAKQSPSSGIASSALTGLLAMTYNRDGDVITQKLTNGLVKEFTYEKDAKGNVTKITEKTLYPHDPAGPGSTESRELNLAGQVVKVTDKNGVTVDITTRENAKGEKEITRRTRFTPSPLSSPPQGGEGGGEGVIDFTELERTNRYGHTLYRSDRNGRVVTTSLRYSSLGRVEEATEITDFVMVSGERIHYEEFFRFNPEGEQVFVRDKNAREIEFEYVKDASGNTAEIKEKDRGIGAQLITPLLTTKRLSPLGETLSQTDKNGFTTAYSYDKDALGNVTSSYEIQKLRYDFNEKGSSGLNLSYPEGGDNQVDDLDLAALVAVYDQTDNANLSRFDLTGDGVINEEDAKLLTRSREYGTREVALTRQTSPLGDLTAVIDRNGRRVDYVYEKDSLGNVKRSIESNSQFLGKIFRLFNKDGQLIQMKDQNGNAIRYLYTLDPKGNILETKEEQELAPKAPVAIKETFDSQARRILWEQGDRKIATTYNTDGSFKEVETDTLGLIRETDFDSQGRKITEWMRRELGKNLALGVGVTTSGSQDSSTYPPTRLVDGVHDRSKPWYSKNQADGLKDTEFIQLDLGSVQTLAEVRVDTGTESDTYFVRRFDVSLSTDGVTWKKVGGQLALNYQGIMTVSFPEEQARFVKIHNFQSLNGAGDFSTVSLNEIEVFGFDYTNETTTYETDASGNTTITTTDAWGLVRKEIRDSQGRVTYLKEKKPEGNSGFGNGLTVNGDTKIDTTQSQFGSASAAFDGSGDYLTLPDSDDWDFDKDFTVEMWVRPKSLPSEQVIYDNADYYSGGMWIAISPTQIRLAVNREQTASYAYSSTFSSGHWYHIAVSRQGSILKTFVDGVQVGSETDSSFIQSGNGTNLRLGVFHYTYDNSYERYFNGQMDEVRVSKGVARYTQDFTPPTTEYTADPETKLLHHFNGWRYDEKWTTYETEIELTPQGDAQIDTGESEFGGSSVQFDGAGDYLNIPDSEEWNFGTEDFTIDTWVRFSSLSGYQTLWSQATDKNNYASLVWSDSNNKISFNVRKGGTSVIYVSASWMPSLNAWQHVALTRQGTDFRIFVDGIQAGTTVKDSDAVGDYTGNAQLGSLSYNGTQIWFLNGWFDEFRVSKGIARWTSNFTPPASEYSTDSKTRLLLHFNGQDGSKSFKGIKYADGIGIQGNTVTTTTDAFGLVREEKKDSQGRIIRLKERQPETNRGFGNQVTVNGDAKIDSAQSKFGGASALFAGGNDYVSAPDNSDFNFGSGDFTVDFWARWNESVMDAEFIGNMSSAGVGWSVVFLGNQLRICHNGYTTQALMVGWTPSANTWYHIAVARSGNNMYFFVNGTQQGATQSASGKTYSSDGSEPFKINGKKTLGGGGFSGWMDEVRISKGTARWTSDFTPSASEYTTDPETKLLHHFNGWRYAEEWTTYTTDAQGNAVTTVTDSFGLVREETRGSTGRIIHLKERRAETNQGFGSGVTPNGDAKIDTTQSKLGPASALFDGADDYLSTTSNLSDFSFGMENFTIDFRIRFNKTPAAAGHCMDAYNTDNNVNAISFCYDNVTYIRLNSGLVFSTLWTPQANTWYHIALVRSGTALTFHVDGTAIGSASSSHDISVSNVVRLGVAGDGLSYDLDGWLDEYRISKGIARDFSSGVPTTEYTADSYTKLLLHLNGTRLVDETYTYSTDAFGNLITKITDDLGNVKVSEEIRDAEGKLIRTDWHYQKDGKDYLILLGSHPERSDTSSSAAKSRGSQDPSATLRPQDDESEDLTSALPVALATNSNYEYAERAIDGKFGAYASAKIGGTFTLELEKPEAIGRLDTYFDRSSGVRYLIEASLDGQNWHTVVDKTSGFYRGLQSDNVTVGSPGLNLGYGSAAGIKAQFVRIRATASENGAADFKLEEIRLYPPKGWGITSTVTRAFNIQGDLLSEVQTGARAESFTYEKDSLENVTRVTETHHRTDRRAAVKNVRANDGTSGITRLTDGNPDTGMEVYRLNDKDGYWDFELKESAEISEIRMLMSVFQEDRRYAYWVDVSLDGTNWIRVFDHPTADARSWQRAVFSPAKARFVRIGGHDDDRADGLFQMYEVEIYSAAVPAGGGTPTGVLDYVTSRYVDQEIPIGANIHPVVANGDVRHDTAQSKFGGASALFDGSGDYLIVPDSSDWDFGTGDFTIDLRVRFNSLAGRAQTLIQRRDPAAGRGLDFSIDQSSGETTFGVSLGDDRDTRLKPAWTPSVNTWYHIAVTRSEGSLRLFVDGKQMGPTITDSTNIQSSGPINLGSTDGTSYFLDGRLDEVRVSKGLARWTSDFTPSVAEYATDAYTKLLLHMNGVDGSARFVDDSLFTKSLPKEGKVEASIDRDFKLTRYAYEYDASGNQIGTYQIGEKEAAGNVRATDFSGEVRDTSGRVIRQISDNGQVTYFTYELDEFGNIKKAFIRDSAAVPAGGQEPETVGVRRNLLQAGADIAITGPDWVDIDLKADRKNKLFDGDLTTGGYVYTPAGTEKPLTFDFKKTLDLSRVRFFARDLSNAGYRIEVSGDGVSWTLAADRMRGSLKKDWVENDHEISAASAGVQYLRIVPYTQNDNFYLYEIQIFGSPAEEKNYETVREYDFRGNVTAEENILYSIWKSRPELQTYFPDPGKKGVLGRWKDKTIADWAKEEGWLEDVRLHQYRPQEEWATPELKDAFDSRRDLQRRFTDETALRLWAEKFGNLIDPRLAAYKSGRAQEGTAAQGLDQPLAPLALVVRKDTTTVKEFQELSLGKTAWATTGASSVPNAMDNDPATAWWTSSSAVKENAFTVDLWQESGVTEVRLRGDTSSNYHKSFRVSTSLDGINWTVAAEPSGGTTPQEWVVSIPPTQARYVRIDKIEAATSTGASQDDFITDLRIFGNLLVTVEKEYSAAVPEGGDAADQLIRETRIGGKAGGTTEYLYHANGTVAEKRLYLHVNESAPLFFESIGTSHASLIDGSEASYDTLYWSETETPKSFVVKLVDQSSAGLNLRYPKVGKTRIKVGGDNTAGHSYTVEASKDGINWIRIVDKTWPGFGGWIEDEFAPVEAQYLRLTGHYDSGFGRSLTVYEVEAYSPFTPSPPSSPPSGGEGRVRGLPYLVERFDESANPTSTDNALLLVWKSNLSLQQIFPSLTSASTASGRWNGKTLLQWAQEAGYKHYASLASYAPAATTEILPGLRQVFDETRPLQDRFRKDGAKDADLIQYSRNRGFREDSRLFPYAPFPASQEVARKHSFETRFDKAGNASILIAYEDSGDSPRKGRRTERRFNAEGRLVGERPELILLWETRPELFKNYTDSSSLHTWATSTGYKDPILQAALSDYSPYAIGGQDTSLPYLMEASEFFDPLGFVKETRETIWNLSGSLNRTNQTFFNSLGHETQAIDEQGNFSYTNYLDREGRLIRRTDQFGTPEWFAVDIAPLTLSLSPQGERVGVRGEEAAIIRNFLLLHGRLPSLEELNQEVKLITELGHYSSRARLSLTPLTLPSPLWGEGWGEGARTPVGFLDSSLVKSYGLTQTELSEISSRASTLYASRSEASLAEASLETKHLETLAQKIFRRLLGRDPSEEKGTVPASQGTVPFSGCPVVSECSELQWMTAKLRELNSVSGFESFLKNEYNLDASGKTEHTRRQNEIQGIIDSVYDQLLIYFGFVPDQGEASLAPTFRNLLKLLKADPAFELKELSRAELDKIKSRLESLIEDDIHFGQSAVHALQVILSEAKDPSPEMLRLRSLSMTEQLRELTQLVLFSDILTGVISPEFIGNLQFSAYTLKQIARSFGLELAGLRMTLDDLKALIGAGYPVLVSIEDRHFVVVTAISTDSVVFLENSYTRVKPLSEFQARWFGVGLVDGSALSDPALSALRSTLSAKILTTPELLKVKGAGWFKKLFKKIAKFFQKIFQAVVKVLVKIRNALQKFLNTGFGKVVGFIFGGPLILAALNFAINSFSYLAQGDIKGLFKYWGQNVLQIALMAASFALMFIPGLGQALAAGLKFVFQGLFAAVQFALGAALQFIGSALSGLGSVLGSFAQGLGGFFRGAGSFLSQTGSRLVSQAQSSLKELFSNLKSAFSQVGESLKRSLGGYRPNAQPLPPHAGIEFSPLNLENIPAHPWITNHGLGFVAQETSKIAQKSLLQRITDYVNKFSLSFIQQKIDQKLEKSKMNSFVKSLLGFFTGAALGAVTGALISSAAQTLAPALGSVTKLLGQGLNALYQGGKAILSTLGRGVQAVGRGISNAFSGVKSFFSNLGQKIFGTRNAPVNAPELTRLPGGSVRVGALGSGGGSITVPEGALGGNLAYASDNTGIPTELLQGNSRFILNPVSGNILRGDLDAANLVFVKPDSRFGALSQIEKVGNLPSPNKTIVPNTGGRGFSATLRKFVRPSEVFSSTKAENDYYVELDKQKGLEEVKFPWEYLDPFRNFVKGGLQKILKDTFIDELADRIRKKFEDIWNRR